jgi:hypothetical protein
MGQRLAPANGRNYDNAIYLIIAYIYDPGVHHAGAHGHNDFIGELAEEGRIMGVVDDRNDWLRARSEDKIACWLGHGDGQYTYLREILRMLIFPGPAAEMLISIRYHCRVLVVPVPGARVIRQYIGEALVML